MRRGSSQRPADMRLTDTLPGTGLVLGVGFGATIGALLATPYGLLLGAGIGAAMGLLVGAAIRAVTGAR